MKKIILFIIILIAVIFLIIFNTVKHDIKNYYFPQKTDPGIENNITQTPSTSFKEKKISSSTIIENTTEEKKEEGGEQI